MKLSDRLQLIADEIKYGETMADIGTDHGFLPLYLLESGKSPKVIMADISSGSLKKAEDNCKLAKPSAPYELRLGNGIDVLEDNEVDAVVIAGMGGLLIADILEWNILKSRSFKKYILQPRNNVGKLRHWLYNNGFTIVKESIVREGKFLCEILTVESLPAAPEEKKEYSAEFDYPHMLLECKSDITEEYLKSRLKSEKYVYDKIINNSKNPTEDSKAPGERIERLKSMIKELEEG